jgi:hypothetical protein
VSHHAQRAGSYRRAVSGCLQNIAGARFVTPGRIVALGTGTVAVALALAAVPAAAAPGQDDWQRLRVCESGNNYRADTGNGFYGAYQFTLGTWAAYGGAGRPSEAAPGEQDRRALMLYQARGWRPWPGCSRRLGLRDDRRGRSDAVVPVQAAAQQAPRPHVSRSVHRAAVAARPHQVRPVAVARAQQRAPRPAPAAWSAGDAGRWGRTARAGIRSADRSATSAAGWAATWAAVVRLTAGPPPRFALRAT